MLPPSVPVHFTGCIGFEKRERERVYYLRRAKSDRLKPTDENISLHPSKKKKEEKKKKEKEYKRKRKRKRYPHPARVTTKIYFILS